MSEAEETKKVQDNESKADKFVRLGEYRVNKAIYDAIDKMGFSKGNILEPAMGTGNFFGRFPEKMQYICRPPVIQVSFREYAILPRRGFCNLSILYCNLNKGILQNSEDMLF